MLPADTHRRLEPGWTVPKLRPFITTTHGIWGHFAVMYWWNDEDPSHDGFWEPWNTGFGRYTTKLEARQEAVAWAADEGLEYKER